LSARWSKPLRLIAEVYGVTEQTARTWAGEPVNPNSRPYLYDVEDLPDQMGKEA